MPKRNLVKSDFLPYHVTNRTLNKEPFPLPLAEVWEIITFELQVAWVLFEIEIHAFVLMPNHYHLLLTSPKYDISKVMHHLGIWITDSINQRAGRCGNVFGGRFHATLVNSGSYFACAFKYIYRNPVRAGISAKVEHYPYSTLSGMLGQSHLPFPLYFPKSGLGIATVPRDSVQLLTWLNTPSTKEAEEAVRKAFRRSCFELPANGSKNRKSQWLELFERELSPFLTR